MSRERPLPPDVRALLDHERAVPPLPATVRGRAVARARAALLAGVERRAAPPPMPRTRWAAIAAMLCIVSIGVGAGAYQIRARLASPRPAAPVEKIVTPKVATPPPSLPPAQTAELPPAEAPAPLPGKPALSRADAARAELRLLRQARVAVALEDYAAALPPIAEHARQFKNGRLTEEREALRVKSLAGLGRTAEARRAAAAFRARFPRSVLLPAISQMPASEP